MQANRFWFKNLTAILAILIMSTSCVEKYWPELNENSEQLLVIDGNISNFPGPYSVKLAISSPINDYDYIPLPLATVTIIDNQGNKEVLIEKSPGNYETIPEGIQGIIGRSYKIKIQLNNGKLYESDFEEMQIPVEVENISVEESIKLAENALETDKEGFQFYVSSKQAETTNTYFYWEIEETYEYRSDYHIYFLYDGKTYEPTIINFLGLAEVQNQDTLFYCWKTQAVPERYSYSTQYLSIPAVNKMPLHFVPFTDEKLRYKYSTIATQFTISEEAYTFLNTIEKQNDNQGALFTSQPFQVRGNVTNLNNPEEPVLGYFMVASGSKSKRLLTKAPSIVRWSNTKCLVDTTLRTFQNQINWTSSENLPIYFSLVYFESENPNFAGSEVLAYIRQDCIDCTRKGGVTIKPEYWDW